MKQNRHTRQAQVHQQQQQKSSAAATAKSSILKTIKLKRKKPSNNKQNLKSKRDLSEHPKEIFMCRKSSACLNLGQQNIFIKHVKLFFLYAKEPGKLKYKHFLMYLTIFIQKQLMVYAKINGAEFISKPLDLERAKTKHKNHNPHKQKSRGDIFTDCNLNIEYQHKKQ